MSERHGIMALTKGLMSLPSGILVQIIESLFEQNLPDGLMEPLIQTELLVTEQLTKTQNNKGYN